jgi:hypothetical protein
LSGKSSTLVWNIWQRVLWITTSLLFRSVNFGAGRSGIVQDIVFLPSKARIIRFLRTNPSILAD